MKFLNSVLIALCLISTPLAAATNVTSASTLPDDNNADGMDSGGAKAAISTTTKGSDATLKISGNSINPDLGLGFRSWSLSIKSPFDDKLNVSEPANLDGFAKDTTITFGRNWGSTTKVVPDDVIQRHYDDCAKINKTPCPIPNAQAAYLFGISISAGYDEYEYTDSNADFAKKDGNTSSSGVDIYGSYFLEDGLTILSMGAKYQHAYEDAKEITICPTGSGTDTYLSCLTGPIQAPNQQINKQAYVKIHRLLPQWSSRYLTPAFRLQITRDFENDKLGVDLPIFLFSDDSSKLNGGIRLGWTDVDKDLIAGLFFGGSFYGP